ncbi:MAG: hypothetical protein HYV29_15265 [Ignavibacteriales bacterium]|nr:hypothetical protein [Ignavibacteriales bacterium]
MCDEKIVVEVKKIGIYNAIMSGDNNKMSVDIDKMDGDSRKMNANIFKMNSDKLKMQVDIAKMSGDNEKSNSLRALSACLPFFWWKFCALCGMSRRVPRLGI